MQNEVCRCQARQRKGKLVVAYTGDSGAFGDASAGRVEGIHACAGVVFATRDLQGEIARLIVVFVEHDQVERGGGRILDGCVNGAICVVSRACVDLGRAEFSTGTIVVEIKIEGGRDEGGVAVQLP